MEDFTETQAEENNKEAIGMQREDLNKKRKPGEFLKDERGVTVIEIVLILVILIGLVLIFKEQITAIVNNAFSSISGDAGKIMS